MTNRNQCKQDFEAYLSSNCEENLKNCPNPKLQVLKIDEQKKNWVYILGMAALAAKWLLKQPNLRGYTSLKRSPTLKQLGVCFSDWGESQLIAKAVLCQ